ncbi:neurogenic locus Notch protein-like [Microplitis demolitor]|uniref:neurogenic locus Notch protein-like n=1 Tax=Microplitis demolitor TaxID=69319 RepID=UPI0004CD398F|nr:neurogenic locus Notch protein-like [Microplitis demolitor]
MVYSINDFVCKERGNSCASDEDCNYILHAKCSKDKLCTCIANNIRINKTYCAPALGSYCWNSDKCATDHASCIDNECQCNENYLQNSSDQCLPKLLGSFCEIDFHCEKWKFSFCSITKTCTCLINTLTINETSCLPILNVFCQTNDDCKVENSVCIDHTCKCQQMFITHTNTECVRPYLGMKCKRFSDCAHFLDHSECSENKECTCSSGHYAINNETCAPALSVQCRNNETCAQENSVCVHNKCQCKLDYVNRKSECVPLLLGMHCKTETDCQEIIFSTCSDDKMCVCKSNYTKVGFSTCSPLIGGDCKKNNDCVAKNSYCLFNKCRCMENYFAHSNDLCTPFSLDRPCQTSEECNSILNSFCSRDKMCFCTSDYIAINGTKCVEPLNQFCTKNKPCVTKNSICINNECQCGPHFVKHLNAECIPMQYDNLCDEDFNCSGIGRKCSDNGRCICGNNYIALSSTTCASLLNGYCLSNKDCYVKYSVCVSNKCQCPSDYMPHSNYECEPIMLGKFCLTDKDCQKINNARCSFENVCVCYMNYFAFDKFLCVPTLNGLCSDDQDCYFDSFYCSDNQCQCKTNYTAVSVDRCVETHLLSSCIDVSECSDSWHSTCLPEGKCVCALNNIALRPSTCLPILNGYCWKDNQCMAENSVCIDFRCQCKPNFISVANNLCISIN